MSKCHYCGYTLGSKKTIDHVVPISRGGEDSGWNKVAACGSCNVRKGNSWPTCECAFCQSSIRRHASMGTTPAHPRVGWVPIRDKKRGGGRLFANG